MKISPEEIHARETLRRLYAVLDEPDDDRVSGEHELDQLPTDEEAREIVARMGIDVPALLARLRALARDPPKR